MINSFALLIDGIKKRDATICGDAPPWVLEMVLKNLEAAKLRVENGDETREVAEEFYLGACRFVTDQCSDEADSLLDAIQRLLRL